MKLRILLFTALAALLALTTWHMNDSLIAQDAAIRATSESAAADTADDDSHRRLPPYFGDLVTPRQKAQIYQIQDRYESEIEALKAQLREVVAKRDSEVEAVLLPEQRALLSKVKEQSRLLREARAKAAAQLKEQLPAETNEELE